uniref:Uncharacterized protein n=1 Tax=Timspurckia oligopyrenoides TaxID=708627 RepID=A0A7S0ZH05_9RHOD|mmetsp:Transcript_4923/g.8557  ORF Transcript_4923/g.8557 Transcript_4923/m.8557 type:complete len:190 (+) Transcript_4923:138-707(+)
MEYFHEYERLDQLTKFNTSYNSISSSKLHFEHDLCTMSSSASTSSCTMNGGLESKTSKSDSRLLKNVSFGRVETTEFKSEASAIPSRYQSKRTTGEVIQYDCEDEDLSSSSFEEVLKNEDGRVLEHSLRRSAGSMGNGKSTKINEKELRRSGGLSGLRSSQGLNRESIVAKRFANLRYRLSGTTSHQNR